MSFGERMATLATRVGEIHKQRIDRDIRGAIRSGYDGIDFNYTMSGTMPEVVEPFHNPPPDGANGYRTVRYTWDWFSDDELARILTDDEFAADLISQQSNTPRNNA